MPRRCDLQILGGGSLDRQHPDLVTIPGVGALAVGRWETTAYLMVHAAALARVVAGLAPELGYSWLVVVAAWLWAGAFAIYFAVYLPRLLRPRIDGRPG